MPPRKRSRNVDGDEHDANGQGGPSKRARVESDGDDEEGLEEEEEVDDEDYEDPEDDEMQDVEDDDDDEEEEEEEEDVTPGRGPFPNEIWLDILRKIGQGDRRIFHLRYQHRTLTPGDTEWTLWPSSQHYAPTQHAMTQVSRSIRELALAAADGAYIFGDDDEEEEEEEKDEDKKKDKKKYLRMRKSRRGYFFRWDSDILYFDYFFLRVYFGIFDAERYNWRQKLREWNELSPSVRATTKKPDYQADYIPNILRLMKEDHKDAVRHIGLPVWVVYHSYHFLRTVRVMYREFPNLTDVWIFGEEYKARPAGLSRRTVLEMNDMTLYEKRALGVRKWMRPVEDTASPGAWAPESWGFKVHEHRAETLKNANKLRDGKFHRESPRNTGLSERSKPRIHFKMLRFYRGLGDRPYVPDDPLAMDPMDPDPVFDWDSEHDSEDWESE